MEFLTRILLIRDICVSLKSIGSTAKLLKSGKTVALCEQVEDPKLAKGLVRREVVRVYTPGTLFDENLLDAKESNFLASITEVPTPNEGIVRYGMAAADLSTGEYVLAEFCGAHAEDDLLDELIRIEPQELILPSSTLTFRKNFWVLLPL